MSCRTSFARSPQMPDISLFASLTLRSGAINHALTLLPVADYLLFGDCIKGATGEGVDKAFGSGVDYGDAVATGIVVD